MVEINVDMKILILSDSCFNDNVFPMLRAMQEKGYDVTCLMNLPKHNSPLFNIKERLQGGIVSASDYSEIKKYEEYLDLSKVYIVNYQIDPKHILNDLRRTKAIVNFIDKGEFDIIHTDITFLRSDLLILKYRSKILYVKHDPFPHEGTKIPIMMKVGQFASRKLIKYFAILNQFQLDFFCDFYEVRRENVLVNSLGPLDCITVYKDDKIKEDQNNILFWGRIDRYKGLEYLCEAMDAVHNSYPLAKLTIAGSGKLYFDYTKYADKPYFNLINRYVSFDELAHLMQSASVIVCPYVDGTQSGGVLTSLAMRKPIIATKIDAMKNVIENGVNGILVPPRDSNKLANAIIELLNNPDMKAKLVSNIDNEFTCGDKSWGTIVEKYYNMYQYIYNKRDNML